MASAKLHNTAHNVRVKGAIEVTARDRTTVCLELTAPQRIPLTNCKLKYRLIGNVSWTLDTNLREEMQIENLCANEEYEFCLEPLKTQPKQTPAVATLCLGCDVIRSQLDAHIRIDDYTSKDALEKFFKYVNCLLNHSGGTVIIHSEKINLLDKFDQKVDKRLNDLISNGWMYHRVFERSYSDRRHLVYRVKALTGDRPFSTLDFKSKMSQNKGIESPSYVHIKVFLSELCAGESVPDGVCVGSTELTFEQDKLVCLKDTTSSWQKPLQESMTVQAKAVVDPSLYACQTEEDVNSLVKYCWSKLKEYITSFTKIEEGGSVYFGVFEHKQERPIWTTAEPMCMQFLTITPAGLGEGLKVWQDNSKGKNKMYYVSKEAKTKEEPSGELRAKAIPLSKQCRKHFKLCIAEKVEKEMLWTGREKPRDPVHVYFHKVEQSGGNDGCVIEIRVNYYHGLCFSDRNGPEAYIPKDKNANKINATSQLQPVPVEDWIQSFKSENWNPELALKCQDVQWQN